MDGKGRGTGSGPRQCGGFYVDLLAKARLGNAFHGHGLGNDPAWHGGRPGRPQDQRHRRKWRKAVFHCGFLKKLVT